MCRLSLVLCFLFLFVYGGVFGRPPRTPTNVWCVAKSGPSVNTLKGFIQEACGKPSFGLDCSNIGVGRPCYFNNNTGQQASYVLNLFFVKHHTCMTQYGTLAHKDPSSGSCRFPLVNLNG